MTTTAKPQSGAGKVRQCPGLLPLRFLDSSLRWAAMGLLGGLFQTPLYHLRPVGVPSRRIQDFLSINDDGGREWVCCYSNNSFAILDK